jgi:hypothetical protein
MDEIHDTRLHQWLSGCRQLMAISPQHGIDEIDVRSPLGALRFRMGWNHSRSLYVYVPDADSADAALTTRTAPPAGTPVHEVPPAPSMLSSGFWHTVMPRFAADVASGPAGEEWSEAMATITRGIERAHLDFGGEDGLGRAFPEIAGSCRSGMATARDGSIAGGAALIDAYLSPVLELTRAYMSFRLPGLFASELLAWALTVQLNLPELGPASETPPDAWVRSIEHLVSLANRLIRRRAEVQVTPYCELSYLANLYFLTASTLRERADQGAVLSAEQAEAVRGLTFVGEERRAHQIGPVFHTGLHVNEGKLVIDAAASTGQSLSELCRVHAVHPALRRVLAALGSTADADPELILRDYRQAADRFEQQEVFGCLDGEYSPVAPEHRQQIHNALQALAS